MIKDITLWFLYLYSLRDYMDDFSHKNLYALYIVFIYYISYVKRES